ncbi:Ca2+/H+ antiporter [Corynebacterium suranareeae]|uniref:Ca2+/H+ antiporter n=1 Tax=Corynebacterium suranareeae TaxID=2506452 RepID=A0A160PQZ4_9CORY|nr:calcium:proton antiporter [Corynebacterium suranareeae]BAU95463.1 Ca2+/H+ antiporter [Corynebacterium suranareeae]
MPFSLLKPLLKPLDYARIIIGWASIFLIPLIALPSILELAVIVAVILFCAFGVVKMAERLAHILGDPFGSLILTLSIVIIEVILICAVMLGPGDSAIAGRDSVMAVSMIIMGLVVGLCLLIGGLRHGSMPHNGVGAPTYLTLITTFSVIAFAVPAFLGEYTPGQSIVIAVLTVVVYGFFLLRQTGAQASEFQEVEVAEKAQDAIKWEVPFRGVVLIITVLPIVMLSHNMAQAMDEVLDSLGAPVAMAGLIIATIVFLPETITSLKAAWTGEIQRVSNLAHGALVSTVGLTIPSVLIIGTITGQEVILGETPINLLLLGTTIAVTAIAFSARKVSAVHGSVLLMVFGVYMMSMFG